MSKVSFTKNQQDAINVETSNILVSAAAGSGKTAVLSQRVIRLLTKENPIDANRLVIVTYTVLAAAEMRSRIAGKLSELIELDPTNKQLQSQHLLLSSAKISTIHSLCTSLIRENFQKLNLSQDFRVADETELTIIKSDSVDEVFGEYYDNKDMRFLELVEFVCVKNDTKLVSLILSVYDFIRSFPFPKQFLQDCINTYKNATSINDAIWYNGLREHINDALSSAITTLNNAIEQIESVEKVKASYGTALDYDLLQTMAIYDALNQSDWDKAVSLVNNYQKLRLSPCRYEDSDFIDDVKQKRAQAHSIIDIVKKNYLQSTNEQFLEDIKRLTPVIEVLFDVTTKVYDTIELKKQEKTVIDFADLEHYALKLLVKEGTNDERSDIALELCESFDEIMIDECQDINEVQNLIFKLLSNQENNVFMVGDVKQSIYRFRKAMPTLFIQKKNSTPIYDAATHTKESNAVITLEDNFRSRSEVCDTVNLIFNQIMSTQMGEIEYDKNEELVASASYQPHDDATSEVHLIDSTDEDELKSSQVEAKYIANLIKQKVQNGYKVEKNGKLIPCRYGDFAILLRAKKSKNKIYLDALKQEGIACFCDATDGYFNEYEIAVTLNLLRVIDNPLKDICLASVLMSPMFGFDADELAKIRLRNANTPLYLALIECARDGDTICKSFISSITALRQKSAVCTIEELLITIYDQTDFISLVYALGNGQQRDANLRLLLTYANKYESMGSYGLSGFLRYIDRVIKNKQDFSCANILTQNENTVKIMSIHSSKGLEFPICIVADCAKGFNLMDLNKSYQLNAKQFYGMEIVDKQMLKKYSNLPFEAVKLATLKETIAEEMRVLYVALTRAREKLIMVMTMNKPDKKIKSLASTLTPTLKLSPFAVFQAKSYSDWILMSILRHPSIPKFGIETIPVINSDAKIKLILVNAALSCEQAEPIDEQQKDFAEVDQNIKNALVESFNFKYANEQLTKIEAKLTATRISKQENEGIVDLKVNPSFMQNKGLTPAMKGTILHSFMQYADFDSAKTNLDNELARLVTEEFLSEMQVKSLEKNSINAFLQSSLYSQMQQSDKVLREYKFLHFIKASDVYNELDDRFKDEQILIQGIADCIIISDSKATIVDYKTDRTTSEQVLIERYKNQLSIYKSAIEQSLLMPVECCKIYSLYLNKEIIIDV